MSQQETYYIPAPEGGFPCMGHLAQCRKCKRKMIVDLPLIGTPHHMGAYVCCLECIEIDSTFREKHPEIASKIDQWKENNG